MMEASYYYVFERKVVGSIYGDLSHPHNIQFHDSEYWI